MPDNPTTLRAVAELIAEMKAQETEVRKAVRDQTGNATRWMERARTGKEVILIGVPVLALVGSALILMFVGAWRSGLSETVVPIIRDELGITADLEASREEAAAGRAAAEQTRDLVIRALGEDRVIRQAAGLSYVEEPVMQGEDVSLVLVIERTNTGAACRFVGGSAIFEDAQGIPLVSEDTVNPTQQIGTGLRRLRVTVAPPKDLKPGRVVVYLSLDYECAGKLVPDRTDALPFLLMPRQADGGR